METALCGSCPPGQALPRRPGQRTCRRCHAAYQRVHRPAYRELTEEQKRRADARTRANVAQRRGVIVPQPCADCGAGPMLTEKHHPDYDKPLEVVWLCVVCHRAREARARVLQAAVRERLERQVRQPVIPEFAASA